MNTPSFTRVKNRFIKIALFVICSTITIRAHADWTVDFSRRTKATRDSDLHDAGQNLERAPASVRAASDPGPSDMEPQAKADKSKGLFDTIFETGEPIQEIVILNTEKGFVPSTVRVRKNGHYKIHVVNVNEKEKNVSFILDGFSEHHATYYGKIKTFELEPKKDGVFSFQSPETAAEGKLVVFNPQATLRSPSSASNAGDAPAELGK